MTTFLFCFRETIWKLRVDFLQERVLSRWENFTIWNAGKQGRKLYRSLSPTNQRKVKAFCDVDENKIQKSFYTYEESEQRPKPKVPILHYKEAKGPFIICVKLVSRDRLIFDRGMLLQTSHALNDGILLEEV
uniref:UDP-GlcNAc:betaGal beta-1,3-N-acetylglucosaminyltransferase-like protein 1 n=1 Tax=Fundulus heteroclitus TaxID=8078 RepID=A0A3Q2PXF5_FUNHE